MAIFKIVSESYPTLADITKVIGYIIRESATTRSFICTNGIYLYTPESMAKQIMLTKNLCGQTTGRQLYHIILSYKHGEIYNNEQILDFINRLFTLPDLYGHQSIAAVHMDTDQPHAHILFNSVNSFTGEKIDLTSIGFWRKQFMYLASYSRELYGYSVYFTIPL